MHLISGAIMFLTLTALLYATNDVWTKSEYDRFESTQPTAMET